MTYCVAVDNDLARLYISWREDYPSYHLQQIDTFVLSRPEEFKDFRKQVRNILDWGKDARLTQIRDALDIILKENTKSVLGGQLHVAAVVPKAFFLSSIRSWNP